MRLVLLLIALGGALPLHAEAPAPAPLAATLSPDLLLARIAAALAAGRPEIARDLITRGEAVLALSQLLQVRADYALATGATDEALAAYAKLAADPAHVAAAQLGLGLAHLRKGSDALAATHLDAALAADPALVRAWVASGIVADRGRDWPRADAAYARALALDARCVAALANRGYSHLLRGHFAEAAADSAQALAIAPGLATARNNLRLARAMQGDYKAAFAGSTKLGLASDLNTVGFAAMARGDYALAETFFNRAMEASPAFNRVAWENLIYLKQMTRKPLTLLSERRR